MTPSGGSFSATHVYTDDTPTGTVSDIHEITAVVTNATTGTANGSAQVTVYNVAPTIAGFDETHANFGFNIKVQQEGHQPPGEGHRHRAVGWSGVSNQVELDAVARRGRVPR